MGAEGERGAGPMPEDLGELAESVEPTEAEASGQEIQLVKDLARVADVPQEVVEKAIRRYRDEREHKLEGFESLMQMGLTEDEAKKVAGWPPGTGGESNVYALTCRIKELVGKGYRPEIVQEELRRPREEMVDERSGHRYSILSALEGSRDMRLTIGDRDFGTVSGSHAARRLVESLPAAVEDQAA